MITGSCHCGAVRWIFDGTPDSATACNCTICRRYGALWAYDWLGHGIGVQGETAGYRHGDREIEFHRCPTCGCVSWWQGAKPDPDGRTRIAVNLRLADDPGAIAAIPVRHFDGLDSWQDLPDDGRCIRDLWF